MLLLSLITAKFNNHKSRGSRPSHCFREETKPGLGTTRAAVEERYTSKPAGNDTHQHRTSQLVPTAAYYFPPKKVLFFGMSFADGKSWSHPTQISLKLVMAFTVSGCNKPWSWFSHPCRRWSLSILESHSPKLKTHTLLWLMFLLETVQMFNNQVTSKKKKKKIQIHLWFVIQLFHKTFLNKF